MKKVISYILMADGTFHVFESTNIDAVRAMCISSLYKADTSELLDHLYQDMFEIVEDNDYAQ